MIRIDSLTIRSYPSPSFLTLVDNHVFQYYPELSEYVKVDKDYSFDHDDYEHLCSADDSYMDSNVVFEISGTFYSYQYESNFCNELDSPLPEKCLPHICSWFDLPEVIRENYVNQFSPDISYEEKLILIYGKETAERMLEHDMGIDSHLVYNSDITGDIEDKIGRFNDVRTLDSGYLFPENTATDKTMYFRYLIDSRWLITVIKHSPPFNDINEAILFYTPKDHTAQLMLNKINQIIEALPTTTLNILDLKSE